jgi:hypothetical protein
VLVPLSLDDARRLVDDFVDHYNGIRLHSAIGYVTPKDKLEGRAPRILEERDRKLAEARERRRQLRQTQHESAQAKQSRAQLPRPALDFAAIRAAISIAAVLQLLGCEPLRSQRAQHRGPCPLHGTSSGTSRCFSVNHTQNVYHCFKCGRSGNALDLWATATRQTPYDAALDLCQRLNITPPTLPTPTQHREEEPVDHSSDPSTMNHA